MNIFLSYASEDRAIADRLAIALGQDGHDVFFDRDRLLSGEEYHARIRGAVDACDLFVFLISPSSIESKSYALTELALARARWRNPSGRILPVIAQPVPPAQIPPYLSSVTFLEAGGDLVAEVLARIASIAKTARRRRIGLAGAVGAALIALGGAALALFYTWPPACRVSAQLRLAGSGAPAGDYMFVQVSNATGSHDVPLTSGAPVDVSVRNLTASNALWTIRLNGADGTVGEQTLSGCPNAEQVLAFDKEFELVLRPR